MGDDGERSILKNEQIIVELRRWESKVGNSPFACMEA